jgi:hypothetical protein
MKDKFNKTRSADRLLGEVGLVLFGLLGWACEQASASAWWQRTLAWLAIESIGLIGWTIDRLAPVESSVRAQRLIPINSRTQGEAHR